MLGNAKSDTRPTSWLILFGISCLLVAIDYLGGLTSIKNIVLIPVDPVKFAIWNQSQKATDKLRWITYWQTGQKDLQQLQRAYQEQTELFSQVAQLKQENQQIRKMLGADLPSNWKYLPAQVVGRQGTELSINQGEKRGISEGMMVIMPPISGSNRGILLGRVSKVEDRQSRVQSIEDPRTSIPVNIFQKKTATQVAEGLLVYENNRFMVKKLLPDEKIQVGDIVVTKGEVFDSGLNTGWLSGIPIGVVTEVNFENDSDIYQTANVKWLAQDQPLFQVFVTTDW